MIVNSLMPFVNNETEVGVSAMYKTYINSKHN